MAGARQLLGLLALLLVPGGLLLGSAAELRLQDVTAEVLGADGFKLQTLSGSFPEQLLKSPTLSVKQSLQVTARPTNDEGEVVKPQQMFLSLTHVPSGAAAYVVGKPRKEGSYSFAASAAVIEKQIGKLTGTYAVALLAGDASASKGLAWELGSIELELPASDAAPAVRTAHSQAVSSEKPVIQHLFRQPDKRPPASISLAFTLAVGAVFAALVGYLVLGLKCNVKGFPKDEVTAAAALAFHGLIAAMLGLYLLFWCKWNLAQTLPVALGLGVALFAVGHRALSGVATERLAANKSKLAAAAAGGTPLKQE